MFAESACACGPNTLDEREPSPPSGTANTSGGTLNPGIYHPANCDGCRALGNTVDPYLKPCPGAVELFEEMLNGLCGACSALCGFCRGENTPEVAACQACWKEAGLGLCIDVNKMCAADERHRTE